MEMSAGHPGYPGRLRCIPRTGSFTWSAWRRRHWADSQGTPCPNGCGSPVQSDRER